MERPVVLYQKQKNVALRRIYNANVSEWEVKCSCGYCGITGEYSHCPLCGTKTLGGYRYWRDKTDIILVNDEYGDKSFHVTKTQGTFVPGGKNEPSLFTVSDVYKTDYDFMRKDQVQIMHNGEQMKVTKQNIRRALSYIEVRGGDGIFNELLKGCGVSLLGKQVDLLDRNPGIEVLYSTYGSLKMLRYVGITELNGSASKPNVVMDLGKEVWKKFQSSKIAGIGRYLEKIKIAEKECGSARVCEFLSLAETLYSKGTRANRIFGAVYDLFFKYHYDGNRLKKYLMDDICFFQGIVDPGYGAQELLDYVIMCNQMGVRYEKYPRSLKLAHDVAEMNLDIVCDEKTTEAFKNRVDDPVYKQLGCHFREYLVKAPKTPQDLILEGKNLHHCVAAYIGAVIYGDAAVYFLRKKNEPDKSYITLDVRDGALYQAAGFANRTLTQEERLHIQEWCLKMNIGMEAE